MERHRSGRCLGDGIFLALAGMVEFVGLLFLLLGVAL